MGTLRQEMILQLKQGPMDIRAISQALHICEKEVAIHLPHIAKSVVAQGMKFKVHPAFCEKCDFTFSNRQRLTRPGKCPRCRQARIQGPWYSVADAVRGGYLTKKIKSVHYECGVFYRHKPKYQNQILKG